MAKWILGMCEISKRNVVEAISVAHGPAMQWPTLQFQSPPEVFQSRKQAEDAASILAARNPKYAFVAFNACAAVYVQSNPVRIEEL